MVPDLGVRLLGGERFAVEATSSTVAVSVAAGPDAGRLLIVVDRADLGWLAGELRRIVDEVERLAGRRSVLVPAATVVAGDVVTDGVNSAVVDRVHIDLPADQVTIDLQASDGLLFSEVHRPGDRVQVIWPRPQIVPADDPFGTPTSPLTAAELEQFEP